MIWRTFMCGSSDMYGSWKMICILRWMSTSSRPCAEVMSWPSNTILPLVGSYMRMSVRPSVDLPQPDSPTRPNVSPRRMARSMPSTARTTCLVRPKKWCTGKCLHSPVASRMTSDVAPVALAPQRTASSGVTCWFCLSMRPYASFALSSSLMSPAWPPQHTHGSPPCPTPTSPSASASKAQRAI